jgi:hypothetical protein
MIYLLINYYIIRGRIARIQQSKLVADLMSDTFFLGQLYWPSASPQANTATHGLITRPIRKSSRNYKVDAGREEIKISFESNRGMEWGQLITE